MIKPKHLGCELLAIGKALPATEVLSSEIDEEQGFRLGHTQAVTGVRRRFYAKQETAIDLAVVAIDEALGRSGLTIDNIDCIISACGTMEQAIPCNASKVHARLEPAKSVPAFDINMTCLSCVMAMEVAANFIACGQYKNILIFSSDLASVGVDWKDIETGGIFGDGAAALILAATEIQPSAIIASKFETHSEGNQFCEIRGGGSLYHPSKISGDYHPYGKFEMMGKEIYRLAAKVMGEFIENLLQQAGLDINDVDWIVPHQASASAISNIQKKLSFPEHKVINIFPEHGNQIAASIPSALYELVQSNKVAKGDKVLIVGTSAGFSLGALIWEW